MAIQGTDTIGRGLARVSIYIYIIIIVTDHRATDVEMRSLGSILQ